MPDRSSRLDVPVCLLIYRRPEMTRRVLEAVRAARPATLLVVADGPRPGDADEARACAAARAVVNEVDWDCRVLTQFATENMGLRQRVSSGLAWVFDQVDRAIILEDDCLPTASFFPFCDELLTRYADDERVMLISGDNAHGWRPRGANYGFTSYALIWGWATWRRAWRRYDDTMSSWPALRDAGWMEKTFGHPRAVAHWRAKFEDGHRRFNSWARAWVYACLTSGGLCAVPAMNLVSNIGFGEEATHTKGLVDGRSAAPTQPLNFPLRHPEHVAADPAADRFLERRLFGGAGLPVSCDVLAAWTALQAWRAGNPWAAGRALEALDEQLPGSDAVALVRAALLGRLGFWDKASPLLGQVRVGTPAGELLDAVRPALDPARRGARVMPKPGREDRLRLLRRAGLDAAPEIALERLGGDSRGYGAWVIAEGVLGPDSVCYLAGAGEDLTFDCAVTEKYGCEVHILDPTPRAVAHFAGLGGFLARGAAGSAEGVNDPVFSKYTGVSQAAYSRLRYHPFGLFDRTATLRFYAPRVAAHVSHSVVNLQGTEGHFEAQCLTLRETMRSLGHTHIDLLKLDIEGAEYCVVESFLKDGIDVGMVCIEFDEGHNPLDQYYQERILTCVALLRAHGYRALCLDDWNMTFVRRRPAGPVARAQAALAALAGGDALLASNLLAEIAADRPGHVGPLHVLALAQARAGLRAEALRSLEALVALAPGHRIVGPLRRALSKD